MNTPNPSDPQPPHIVSSEPNSSEGNLESASVKPTKPLLNQIRNLSIWFIVGVVIFVVGYPLLVELSRSPKHRILQIAPLAGGAFLALLKWGWDNLTKWLWNFLVRLKDRITALEEISKRLEAQLSSLRETANATDGKTRESLAKIEELGQKVAAHTEKEYGHSGTTEDVQSLMRKVMWYEAQAESLVSRVEELEKR